METTARDLNQHAAPVLARVEVGWPGELKLRSDGSP
jgi:antitoxin (DNA-binding transcriptional repressor) of toxin-antitoxin stability system